MKLVSALRSLAFTCAMAGLPAWAGVIYQQAPAGSVSSAWTSHHAAGMGGFKSFENFQVDRDASVGIVSWRGTYFDISGGTLAGGVPNTDTWTIEFWEGDASGPTGLRYQASYLEASVQRRLVGTGDFGAGPFNVYDFELDLADDFDLTADQQYWISIVSRAATFSPLFSWTNADGGGSILQQQLDGNNGVLTTLVRGGDRAFSLSDHTVPEPASLALVAAGLLAAGAARRRR